MANIEYQTNMTALVEKIKTAVRCSRLWVLLPGPPGALGAGRVPPPPPPAEPDQALQAPFEGMSTNTVAPMAQSRGLSQGTAGTSQHSPGDVRSHGI